MNGHLHNNQQYAGNITENWLLTGYLLSNIYAGIGEITRMGYCVDDMQKMQTVESQLMTSW